MKHRRRSHQALHFVVLACGCLLFIGCGPQDRVKVFPVSGTVMLEWKPMEGGGSISFIPLESQPGKTAGGTINLDGTYVMRTYSSSDGSMPGRFRVVINQVTQTEPENTSDGKPPGEAKTIVSVEKQIPMIYSNFNESPLTANVEPKTNEIHFELTRKK